jgi:hypothetical protein
MLPVAKTATLALARNRLSTDLIRPRAPAPAPGRQDAEETSESAPEQTARRPRVAGSGRLTQVNNSAAEQAIGGRYSLVLDTIAYQLQFRRP